MIVFRKATLNDLDEIDKIYNRIHTQEENGEVTIGWVRSIYPTYQTAKEAIEIEDMFVEEVDGIVVGSARINQMQMDAYALANWKYKAKDEEVMVLHTLTIDPRQQRNGYAAKFIEFYEKYAIENRCTVLRIDTNEKNEKARKMYAKLGYSEASVVPCSFNGITGVQLICLEKTMNAL